MEVTLINSRQRTRDYPDLKDLEVGKFRTPPADFDCQRVGGTARSIQPEHL